MPDIGLSRMTGIKIDGTKVDSWSWRTIVLRRIAGSWKIIHEHASFPMANGRKWARCYGSLAVVPECALKRDSAFTRQRSVGERSIFGRVAAICRFDICRPHHLADTAGVVGWHHLAWTIPGLHFVGLRYTWSGLQEHASNVKGQADCCEPDLAYSMQITGRGYRSLQQSSRRLSLADQ
ncbi:hypothetical protein CK218_27635 [Mesorhizobium sp. WSM3879]|nr:hypothetical protein CK218_27635 [Mesorhizobium sp. WSM3879]